MLREESMKTNRWFLAAALCASLISSTARGQQSGPAPLFAPPPTLPVNGEQVPPGTVGAPNGGPIGGPGGPVGGSGFGLSDWITYSSGATAVPRDCCFGLFNRQTPLYTELYLRAGPAFPVSGETLSRELKTGWSIIGGARALFFNSEMTAAWTIDPHIINTWQSGGNQETRFPVRLQINNVAQDFVLRDNNGNVQRGITVKAVNYTMGGLGFGREWYLWSPANMDDLHWRVGIDGGPRWGSMRLDPNEVRHLTDVIFGMYFAVHSDLEIPIKTGTIFTGFRAEWVQIWSDVLQQNSNLQTINFLVTAGLRF
jgi:hypothetical protein